MDTYNRVVKALDRGGGGLEVVSGGKMGTHFNSKDLKNLSALPGSH